ncbi:hypothetical protein F4777DRAFT_599917 [Nemania sp. FL0916]|nr:hypothetical protein F4777DRAFT_599917 [Nemania sp. FL0916]
MASVSSYPSPSYALPSASQIGPRDAILVMLPFQLDTSNKNTVQKCYTHLRDAFVRVQQLFPFLGSQLRQDAKGIVIMTAAPDNEKTYFKLRNDEYTKSISYEHLEKAEFSPSCIEWTQLSIDNHSLIGGGAVPIAGAELVVIDGGLLFFPFIHHCAGDGAHMARFLETFSAATRNKLEPTSIPPLLISATSQHKTQIEAGSEGTKKFFQLLRQCPEYCYNADCKTPCDFTMREPAHPIANKHSEIFAIPKANIQQLKNELGTDARLSTFIFLAALCWSHVADARKTETYQDNTHPPPGAKHSAEVSNNTARMIMPVDWAKRVSPQPESFGYYVVFAVASVDYNVLLTASNPTLSHDERKSALAKVIDAIKKAIAAVDEAYVLKRMDLIKHASDPRLLGLNFDTRSKKDMIFNTWQWMSGDAQWNVGAKSIKPILRKTNIPSPGSGLILPAQRDAKELEIQINLPGDSMNNFKKDALFSGFLKDGTNLRD